MAASRGDAVSDDDAKVDAGAPGAALTAPRHRQRSADVGGRFAEGTARWSSASTIHRHRKRMAREDLIGRWRTSPC